MAYSHQRLRKALAAVRILSGALLLIGGLHKLFAPDFSAIEFPRAVQAYANLQAMSFYSMSALRLVGRHADSFAVAMGLIETALGFALLLGLVIRPAALLGILYVSNFVLVSWHQTGSFVTDLELQSGRLLLLFLLALFALGHAGETWGIGSIYHAHRARLWRMQDVAAPLKPEPELGPWQELDDGAPAETHTEELP